MNNIFNINNLIYVIPFILIFYELKNLRNLTKNIKNSLNELSSLKNIEKQNEINRLNEKKIKQIDNNILLTKYEKKSLYKIFIIGFNKTATRTLDNFFSRNGLKTIHWDEGKLARSMKLNYLKNINLINTFYEQFTVFSDMEDYLDDNYAHIKFFKLLEKQYPTAKFILNIRNLDDWIKSRNNHMQGKYKSYLSNYYNLNAKEIEMKWTNNFNYHIQDVKDYFSDKPGKLLIYNIDIDKPIKLLEFFPEYNLNSSFFGHEGKTVIKNNDNNNFIVKFFKYFI